MPGKDIAIPAGRTVSAPETPHHGHSSDAAGAIPVRVIGPSVEVTAVVNPTTPAAYAIISGDKADEVEITWTHNMWTLKWPDDAGVTTMNSGIFIGNGGSMRVNFGNARGGVYVDGVRVDQMAGGRMKEPPAVHLILPSGCSLHAELQSGSVYAAPVANPKHGLTLINLSSQSGGIETGCPVGQIVLSSQSGGLIADGYTGPVQVSTQSGSIDLAHAMANVNAQTMSGNVHVHCEDSINVSASTMSGSVRVTAAAGAIPTGSGSSMSGGVSVPPSMSGGGRRRGW